MVESTESFVNIFKRRASNYHLIVYSQGGSDPSNKATDSLGHWKWSISVALQCINNLGYGERQEGHGRTRYQTLNDRRRHPSLLF